MFAPFRIIISILLYTTILSNMQTTRRRRAFHTRSRHGCFNCKSRHNRCDERSPTCLNCTKRDLVCSYPAVSSEQVRREELSSRRPAAISLPDLRPRSGSLNQADQSPPLPASRLLAMRNFPLNRLVSAKALSSRPSPSLSSNANPTILQSPMGTWSASSGGPNPSQAVANDESAIVCTLPDICELCYSINYVSPLTSGLPPGAVEVFHNYRDMLAQVLILPRPVKEMNLRNFRSALPLACQFDFVKYSFIYLSAVTYRRHTGCTTFSYLIARYLSLTLIGLQQAISTVSSKNAEAILLATINLSFMTSNWQEWTSYMAGWAAITRYIDSETRTTFFPEVLSQRFWLKLSRSESLECLPSTLVRSLTRFRVETVVSSITQIKAALNKERWQAFGFEDLEILALSVLSLDTMLSVDQVFSHFQVLRIWMVNLEICNDGDKDNMLAKMLRVHFYILLLAVLPYFPPLCSALCRQVCTRMIENGRRDFSNVSPQMRKLVDILWNEDLPHESMDPRARMGSRQSLLEGKLGEFIEPQ